MFKKTKLAVALFMSLIAGLFAVSVSAQTLEAVKARGRVIVGIQGDNPPYGFLSSQGGNDGYDAGVAKLFGEFLGLPVEFFIVTNPNRIAALQTGKVDILFSTLSMTAERAKSLQYSKPYAEQPFTVLAAKTADIKSIAALKGKVVGVPKGSLMDIQLTKLAKESEIRRFDDDSATVQALLSGQADAVGGSMFYAARLDQQAPGKFENKFSTGSLYIGAGTRSGDKQWNATVNSFIAQIVANGKLDALYQKWFNTKLPDLAKGVEGVSFTVAKP